MINDYFGFISYQEQLFWLVLLTSAAALGYAAYKLYLEVTFRIQLAKYSIYEFLDADWIIATSRQAAIKFYCETVNLSEDEIEIAVLSEKKLDKLNYIGYIDEPLSEPITFRQELKNRIRNGFSGDAAFFATSEH